MVGEIEEDASHGEFSFFFEIFALPFRFLIIATRQKVGSDYHRYVYTVHRLRKLT